jgi:hypothetical protein
MCWQVLGVMNERTTVFQPNLKKSTHWCTKSRLNMRAAFKRASLLKPTMPVTAHLLSRTAFVSCDLHRNILSNSFFLWNRRGSTSTNYILIEKILCTKTEKKRNNKTRSTGLQIYKPIPHIIFMSFISPVWMTRENSCLNLILQCCTIISIAKATPNGLFNLLITLIGGSHDRTMIPIPAQQFLAKLHLKNKCPRLFCLCKMHNSQTYESRCMCFLRRSSHVFSLSLNNN